VSTEGILIVKKEGKGNEEDTTFIRVVCVRYQLPIDEQQGKNQLMDNHFSRNAYKG
ncbi:hypothetical protein KI387_004569, partial [Taxus chinensis]